MPRFSRVILTAEADDDNPRYYEDDIVEAVLEWAVAEIHHLSAQGIFNKF